MLPERLQNETNAWMVVFSPRKTTSYFDKKTLSLNQIAVFFLKIAQLNKRTANAILTKTAQLKHHCVDVDVRTTLGGGTTASYKDGVAQRIFRVLTPPCPHSPRPANCDATYSRTTNSSLRPARSTKNSRPRCPS